MTAETVLEKAGTQPLITYIARSQSTVAVWVSLLPILEVYDRETCYEGGGRLQELWWRQTASRNQLSATLKDILAAARERRWKPVRDGKSGGGDRNADESEDGEERDGYRYAGTETGDTQLKK